MRLRVECDSVRGWRWLRSLVANYPARYGSFDLDGAWLVPSELEAVHLGEVARAAGAKLRGAP